MIKKITLFISAILLLISNLSFSQNENPYVNFNPKQLKKNKDYNKNYNPITCKDKIFYACMLDMINAARAEYNFAAPLVKNNNLDSMAIMQGEYQGKKNLKTSENKMGYGTLAERFEKRGFSTCGTELLSKAKTSNGIDEYSYYDACLELLKPILKNSKEAKILLDKKWTYIGFGWGIDKDMKSIFVSIVLANDRTIAKREVKVKDLPYTKRQNGLSGYDGKICAKCLSDKNLEVLSDYIKVEGDQVFFVCNDYKALRKLIGKEGDALLLDFVQTSQYPCDGANVTDNNLVNRGLTTVPFTYQQLIEFNENTDKKSTKLRAHIDDVPEALEGNDFEINLLVIKGGNVCRTIVKKNIESKNSSYTEKINFLKDSVTIATTGTYLPVAEEDVVEYKVPFVPKKNTFTIDELEGYAAEVQRPHYTINKIEIVVHNSLNYKKDAAQNKIQKQRGESMKKAYMQKYPNVPVEVTYDFNFEQFKKDIVSSADYYDLSFLTEDEAYAQLMANKGKAAKALESEYLKKHRYADVILHVTYSVDEKHEEEFVLYKFNLLSGKKKTNIPLLMAMQNHIMKQVENGKYSEKILNIQIPYKYECQPLLNNKLYIQNLLEGKVSAEMSSQMTDLAKMKPAASKKPQQQAAAPKANPFIEYNQMVCTLQNLNLKSSMEISTVQANIDKLYTYTALDKTTLNTLNLEFQIKFLDFLNKQPVTTENTMLLTSTYDKIKAVRNPKLDTWQNAYKLAAIFAQNHDYAYALSLMDPFLDDATISNDFIFSYISIASYSENTFLSGNFTKMVELAAQKDRSRLCQLADKLTICIMDNAAVKKIICKECK